MRAWHPARRDRRRPPISGIHPLVDQGLRPPSDRRSRRKPAGTRDATSTILHSPQYREPSASFRTSRRPASFQGRRDNGQTCSQASDFEGWCPGSEHLCETTLYLRRSLYRDPSFNIGNLTRNFIATRAVVCQVIG